MRKLIKLLFLFIPLSLQSQTNPLQLIDPPVTGEDQAYNYNMGYRFTTNVDGQITALGGKWKDGTSCTVRLYAYPSGTLLASTSVTGSMNWSYATLGSPVSVNAGDQFVVAVRLFNGQSAGCYSTEFNPPVSSGSITIEGTTYLASSNSMPTNLSSYYMYGMADITFEPCTYSGNLSADDEFVFQGDSTTIYVSNNTGSIQWQQSSDNITFSDVPGGISSVLQTGGLTDYTWYRVRTTGGSCSAQDTSGSIKISVLDPFKPLQSENIPLNATDVAWNYNMGYLFTCTEDGDVTQLGGRWTDGYTYTVRLYAYPAGTVLASSSVSGNEDWSYNDITPVSLTVGQQYVVAVRLDGSPSGAYSSDVIYPMEAAGVTINASIYRSASNAMPNTQVTTEMYGQADIRFTPCSFAGTLSAEESQIVRYDSTTISVHDRIGDIQWQSSLDNLNFSDISGATDTIINTGSLDQTTYFRTYISGGVLCSSADTSESIQIKVLDPLRPLQNTGIEVNSQDNAWNYNMGYRFTPAVNGDVTELGGRWKAGYTYTVRLYRQSGGTVLASTNVTGTGDWAYVALGSPVSLTAGTNYVVAVRLDGQATGMSSTASYPVTSGDVTILGSVYRSNSNNIPNNFVTDIMYGQADLKFVPCVYSGFITKEDEMLCPGNGTTLQINDYSASSIQWQSSTDNIIFSDITGETNATLNIASITEPTWFRVVASAVCGNDISEVDSIYVPNGGGTFKTWTALDDSSWNNACNWLEGEVPNSGDSVLIGSGVDAPVDIPSISLSYLEINNPYGISLTNIMRVSNAIVLTNGNIILNNSDLEIDYGLTFTGGLSTSHIVTNGTGVLRRAYTVADGSSFTFPLGIGSTFYPVTIDLNPSSVLGGNPSIELSIVDGLHPNLGSQTNYISAYWTLNSVDISSINYDYSSEYSETDVVGLEALIFSAIHNGSWTLHNPANIVTNTLSGSGITITGDICGISSLPIESLNDGSWSNPLTWLGGIPPSLGSAVNILSGHDIVLDADQSCAGIAVNAGGKLIFDGYDLEVDGNITVEGETDTSGSVTINSVDPVIIFGSNAILNNVRITSSGGVSINSGDQLSVYGTLAVNNNTFTTNTGLVLASNSTSTGSIDAISSGGQVIGNVTQQRFENNWFGTYGDYHLIGSPIQGQTIEDLDDDIYTSGFPGTDYENPNYFISMYTYDETQAGYADTGFVVPSSTTDVLIPGKGYWVYLFKDASEKLMDLTGTITSGNFDFPTITYTDDGTSPSSEHGWNLLSNPYPSAIDWESDSLIKTNLSPTVYVWNADAQNYATYTTGGASTNGGSRYIGSMQGFMVKAVSNTPSPALSIREQAKTSNGGNSFIKVIPEDQNFKLQLSGLTGADELIVRFAENANNTYDPLLDAPKLKSINPAVPYLSSSATGETDLVINSFPKTANAVSIPIKTKSAQAGTFHLKASNIGEFNEKTCVTLEDTYTNEFISIEELSDSMGYAFELSDTTQNNRFLLHINQASWVHQKDICPGNEFGSIELHNSGNRMIEYALSNLENTSSLTGSLEESSVLDSLMEGAYILTLNMNGCIAQDTIHINTKKVKIDTLITSQTTCPSSNDGSVIIETEESASVNYYTYLWSNGNTEKDLYNIHSGMYSLTVTDNEMCSFTIDSIIVPATNLDFDISFSVNSNYLYLGDPLYVENSSEGNTSSFIWNFGEDDLGSIQNPLSETYYYDSVGDYNVSLIGVNQNGCMDTATQTITVSEILVGVQDEVVNNNQIQIFQDKLSIQLKSFEKREGAKVQLMDINGKIVYDQTWNTLNLNIYTESFARGSYVLSVRSNEHFNSYKIIMN